MTNVETIYLAGPMSGYQNFNYDAFNAAADILREAGYVVLNPAEFDGGGQGESWHNYMRKDLAIIIEHADALVCLQDWETSAGAKNEVTVARAIGIPVWDISTFGEVENNPLDDDTWAKNHPEVTPLPSDPLDGLTFNTTTTTSNSAPGDIYINTATHAGHTSVTYTPVTLTWLPEIDTPAANEVGEEPEETPLQEELNPTESYYWNGFGEGVRHEQERQAEERREAMQRLLDVLDQPEAAPTEEDSILVHAEYVVNGERQRDYDHPLDNFQRIVALWEPILGIRVTEEQHALCMIAVKIARLLHTPDHRDSLVDIAGYAATIEKLQAERHIRQVQETEMSDEAALLMWQEYAMNNGYDPEG